MTSDAILEFILEKVGKSLGVPVEKLDPREPFASYGMDSLAAVTLAADLEKQLNRPLPTTIVWDFSTPQLLAAHLAGEAS
jgi:acyl carrier protein